MGNCIFSFGSSLINCFGFGYRRTGKHPLIDGDDSDDDDHIDNNERIVKNVEEMENYCKPLIFVKFKGQTSSDAVRIKAHIFLNLQHV